MRFRDGPVAITALIAFSLWLFIVLPIYYGPANNQTTEQCSEKENKNHGFWEKTRCDPVAFFTAWLVGFTGVLAFSTIGLWIVTALGVRNQTADTRILQRAYLAVTGEGILPLRTIDLHGLSGAHVGFKNAGNLPATDVSWFIDVKLDPSAALADFPIDQTKFYGSNVIPPDTEMRRTQYFSVTGNELTKYLSGNLTMYVYGEVRYLDGFGVHRTTKFCQRYPRDGRREIDIGPNKGFMAIDSTAMRYHRYGNSAD